MALVDDKYTESTDGIKKTIDKGSMGMALDILQRGLYAHPIPSTVRELASNGYDAIKEREVAKSIILGQSPIEDHFDVTKIDGIFHASGWDPTYFDLAWLSDDPYCYLYYEEGGQKDVLRFVDHGVGLGKTRLVNYFMLNWSSKRSNKDALGKFGLGSKVALALGVDSFRVITKYNGRKFKFDVFLDKVESVISKFNVKGDPNEPFVLVPEKTTIDDDGKSITVPAYIAYCETTTDKNGVEIQIDVKKHNKKLFFEAIESQLMYMPNIKFLIRSLGNTSYETKDIAAKVVYRDANVILSESTVFDRPHILFGTGTALVNYGYVSFAELELEPKRGSVGLIMNMNDMEVTPSRETVIWSAKTRAAVLAKYKMVSEMASTYLNHELSSESDYLKWITKAAQILGSMRQGGSNTSVLGRLASIIDMDDIGAVTYPGSSKIIFDTKPKEMFGEALTVRNIYYDMRTRKVERKALTDLCSLIKPVYFTKFGSNPFKDRYIFAEFGDFVLINIKDKAVLDDKGELIVNKSAHLDYEAVVIPDDRMELYLADAQGLTEDEDAAEAMSAPKVDYSAARKVNKQIVLHKLSGAGGVYDYKFSSHDVYISDLFSVFKNDTVLYTTGGDRETMSNILAIFPPTMLACSYDGYWEKLKAECTHCTIPTAERINGVLLAAENVKYVANSTKYMDIPTFMVKSYNSKNGSVVFSDLVRFAATNSAIASIYREKFSKTKNRIPMKTTKFVDPKLHELASFVTKYYSDASDKPLKDIMATGGFLKDAVLFQLYKTQIIEASDETVEDLLKSINAQVPEYLCDLVDEITDVDILDIQLIRDCIKLFDYFAPRQEMIELFSMHQYYTPEENITIGAQLQEYYKFINSNKP